MDIVVVTCWRGVAVVDIDTGELRRLPFHGWGRDEGPFGIDWHEGEIYLSIQGLHRVRDRINVYGPDLQLRRTILRGRVVAPHELRWINDRLYVTSSLSDEIIITDRNGRYRSSWRPSSLSHYNSINALDGDIGVIGWREEKVGVIVLGQTEYTLKDSRAPHNIWRHVDGRLMTLGTYDGHFWCVEEGRGTPLARNNWARGVSLTNERYVIGKSVWDPNRRNRLLDNRGSLQIYTTDFHLLDEMELGLGQIYVIRKIDGDDMAFPDAPPPPVDLWNLSYETQSG